MKILFVGAMDREVTLLQEYFSCTIKEKILKIRGKFIPMRPFEWRNNEDEFKKWSDGETGYPIVDAGMRELNQTGFMHQLCR